jgi:hypothetical protein
MALSSYIIFEEQVIIIHFYHNYIENKKKNYNNIKITKCMIANSLDITTSSEQKMIP